MVTASFKRATFRAFALGTFGFSTLLIALAPVHDARLAGLLLVGIGASFTLFAANANSLVQLAAPDHLRGRLVALYLFSFVGLAPFGSLLSGVLVEIGGHASSHSSSAAASASWRRRSRWSAGGPPSAPSNEGVPADGAPPIPRVPADGQGGSG